MKRITALNRRAATFLVAFALTVTGLAGGQGMKPPAFHVLAPSTYDFGDTVGLLKGAIEAQNLMVIQEIDAQKMLKMVGFQTKGMKQILFFHPRYMKRIIETNKHASIEPPLKVAVMEAPNGKVMVRYIRPSHLLSQYDGLDALGVELDQLVATIVKELGK